MALAPESASSTKHDADVRITIGRFCLTASAEGGVSVNASRSALPARNGTRFTHLALPVCLHGAVGGCAPTTTSSGHITPCVSIIWVPAGRREGSSRRTTSVFSTLAHGDKKRGSHLGQLTPQAPTGCRLHETGAGNTSTRVPEAIPAPRDIRFCLTRCSGTERPAAWENGFKRTGPRSISLTMFGLTSPEQIKGARAGT